MNLQTITISVLLEPDANLTEKGTGRMLDIIVTTLRDEPFVLDANYEISNPREVTEDEAMSYGLITSD